MPTASPRKTAAQRREEILDAALTEFAAHGLDGASTDAIARSAGISQPYLFRLFGTKKQLFIASVEQHLADALERFRAASEGLTGQDAMRALGDAYIRAITTDRRRLRAQMQAYVACEDPEIRAVVQRGYGRLVAHVKGLGLEPGQVMSFFAKGMLINVLASMGLPDKRQPWAGEMLAAFREAD